MSIPGFEGEGSVIEPPNFHTCVHFSLAISNLGKCSARNETHQITIKPLFSALMWTVY